MCRLGTRLRWPGWPAWAWTWTAGWSTRSRSRLPGPAAARPVARRRRPPVAGVDAQLRRAPRVEHRGDSAAQCSIFSDGSATPCDVRRDYELGAEIGAGHFGRVFACDRRADGRKFVQAARDAARARRAGRAARGRDHAEAGHRHVRESRRSTSTGTTRGSCRRLEAATCSSSW